MMVLRLEQILRTVIAAVFLFFVSITFIQVVLRYGFANSLPWIDELSRYSFIWLVFIASAVVARHGAHIAINLVDEMAPPRVRLVLLVLADLSLIVFAAIVGYGGWQLMQLNWTTTSPASGIPIAWVQLVLPLFGVLMSLFAGAHLRGLLKRGTVAPADD
jgi:TRAP-type C4-dicarboxylate transport system permease small subunit